MKIHWQIIVVLIPTWTAANWFYATYLTTYLPADQGPNWVLKSLYQAGAFVGAALWVWQFGPKQAKA